MNEATQIQAYNQIKKHISIPNSNCFGMVKELQRNFSLEFEDIHQELFCEFLKNNKDKEIQHLVSYINRFCYLHLLEMKRDLARIKRFDNDCRKKSNYNTTNEYVNEKNWRKDDG